MANFSQLIFSLTLIIRVKETAAELTNLQSQLADYNLLVDKLNTDTEVILVQQEAQEMAAQNESESREVEALFAEKQNRYACVSIHMINSLHRIKPNT
jgi:glutaredoxin